MDKSNHTTQHNTQRRRKKGNLEKIHIIIIAVLFFIEILWLSHDSPFNFENYRNRTLN